MLNIETVHDLNGDGMVGLFVRGHEVQPIDFYDQALKDYGHEAEWRDNIPPTSAEVMHLIKREWWRVVPSRGTDCESRFLGAEPYSRGAFAVTCLDFTEWR